MLFLQLKQARRSVRGLVCPRGHRVARASGAAGLGGPTDPPDRQRPAARLDHGGEPDSYVRQFRDMKGAVTVEGMDGSRAHGLRPDLRHPTRQGPRPLNRCHDRIRLSRQGRRRRTGHSRASRAPTRTRQKPTTRRSSRPSSPGDYPQSTGSRGGARSPSDLADITRTPKRLSPPVDRQAVGTTASTTAPRPFRKFVSAFALERLHGSRMSGADTV